MQPRWKRLIAPALLGLVALVGCATEEEVSGVARTSKTSTVAPAGTPTPTPSPTPTVAPTPSPTPTPTPYVQPTVAVNPTPPPEAIETEPPATDSIGL